MPAFDRGATVRVPFPHTAGPIVQRRPALVVANKVLGTDSFLIWVVVITSAAHRGWAGDVLIDDLDAAGLSAPCVVRTAKIAVLESEIASHLGRLAETTMMQVDLELRRILDLP